VSSIKVTGGVRLKGETRIQGSKNAALPVIAASLLNKGVTVLRNCPKILDVYHMINVLEELGCKASWEGNSLVIDTADVKSAKVSESSVRKMRSSILFLGALIGRCHEVSIAYPGGCSIGNRPIDFHLDSIRKMNVSLNEENGIINCQTDKITGTDIFLKFPSVGATQNIILAAVLAEGTTRIYNAAREPEVQELCTYLEGAGARLKGKGTSFIEIEGVERLHDVEHTLSPDRIAAGTYMAAVAAAGGDAVLFDVPVHQVEAVIKVLEKTGCKIITGDRHVKISRSKRLFPYDLLKTKPYPGFPTDMQSQLMTVLSIADGKSTIVEEIFDSRFQNAEELRKMGADILLRNEKTAVITGVAKLKGAEVKARDLRAGAAMVIAGLAAEGETTVNDAVIIERGYEDICRDLGNLGANIHYCGDDAG